MEKIIITWRSLCVHRVSAVVHRGRRWQKDGGVLLPGPAEEHPPLHFQEPWPPHPLWSPVAQAEHFCAEQHSVHLHGLQALGEKADRREGRHWPHRAHAHHHTGGGWTACGRTCRATKTIPEFVKATNSKASVLFYYLSAQVSVQHVFENPQNGLDWTGGAHFLFCVMHHHAFPASFQYKWSHDSFAFFTHCRLGTILLWHLILSFWVFLFGKM